jgi:hypothetical protein
MIQQGGCKRSEDSEGTQMHVYEYNGPSKGAQVVGVQLRTHGHS